MLRISTWLALGLHVLGMWGPARAEAQQEEVAATANPGVPITFSNLVLRAEDGGIAFASGGERVVMLETMRHEGWNAVGAESLVFNRDDSANAELVLGGTLREAKCTGSRTSECCALGVDWELMHVATKRVIYKVKTRAAECGVQDLEAEAVGRRLLVRSLRRLLLRPKFAATARTAQVNPAEAAYEPAKVARCALKSIEMKRSAEPALDGTVLLSAGMTHGSGFYLTGDGLLVTAAHVVGSNELQVQARDGTKYTARPLRISRKLDVALLRVDLPPGARTPCLPIAKQRRNVGSELYAIGAPDSKELAFSLTRGILSGTRQHEGVELVQTDAPVSPGNSGGPLVDPKGQVVGIVSRKLVGSAVEGVAFAVPAEDALRVLGLNLDKVTDPALTAAQPMDVSTASDKPFIDVTDLVPTPSPVHHGNSDSLKADLNIKGNYRYFQGRLRLDQFLRLVVVVAPSQLNDRFALTLESYRAALGEGTCKNISLVVNERHYAPAETVDLEAQGKDARTTAGTGLDELAVRAEARFDLKVLSRLDEEAPSVAVNACGQHWVLSRKQVESLKKFPPANAGLKRNPTN